MQRRQKNSEADCRFMYFKITIMIILIDSYLTDLYAHEYTCVFVEVKHSPVYLLCCIYRRSHRSWKGSLSSASKEHIRAQHVHARNSIRTSELYHE